MLFHHGSKEEYFWVAQEYAKISMDMGCSDARWLYAAATDRLLLAQGKVQKYGTQYEWTKAHERVLRPYDTETTDAERHSMMRWFLINCPSVSIVRSKHHLPL